MLVFIYLSVYRSLCIKVKVRFFYSTTYVVTPQLAALYNNRKLQLIGKSQWCGSTVLQLQHTPLPQSTTPGLYPVSIHQMAPPVRRSKHPVTAYYSVYRPQKDERLSRPGWLVTYRNKVPPLGVEPGHVTHPSTNRARRRVTLLIQPTPLPLCHAANLRWSLYVTRITPEFVWIFMKFWKYIDCERKELVKFLMPQCTNVTNRHTQPIG